MRNHGRMDMRQKPVLAKRGSCSTRRLLTAGVSCLIALCALPAIQGIAQDLPLPDDKLVIEGREGQLQFAEVNRIRLDESLTYLSDVAAIAHFDDGAFVVASKQVASVIVYDADGKQRRIIGRWGQGPGEYETPSLVRVDGRRVFIRDDGQSKYIAYDSSGTLKAEWRGLVSGPQDFDVTGPLIVGLTGQSFDYLVQGINTETGDTLRAGPSSVEVASWHVVEGAGKAALSDHTFYYAYPNENAFHVLDLDEMTDESVPLPAEGFRQATYPFDGFEDINRSFGDGRMLRYVFKNSRVEGVRVLDDYVVAVRADGELPLAEDDLAPKHRQRARRFFVYDHELVLKDVVAVDFDHMRMLGYAERGAAANSLFYVLRAGTNGGRDVRWTLLELGLERINP